MLECPNEVDWAYGKPVSEAAHWTTIADFWLCSHYVLASSSARSFWTVSGSTNPIEDADSSHDELSCIQTCSDRLLGVQALGTSQLNLTQTLQRLHRIT